MNLQRIDQAGERRLHALKAFERAHRDALDVVVEEVSKATNGANITAAADLLGVSRQTIYNELGRRQEVADALGSNGAPPPPSADPDTDAVGPRKDLSEPMRRALKAIAEGINPIYQHVPGATNGRQVVAALRRRGLVAEDAVDLTRAGELEAGRL